ncbi:MAG: DUF3226 domain-containing protein [Chitinophagales bacterium]
MKEIGLNKIFVEGASDKLFIDAILSKFFQIEDDQIVINVQGKDNLQNHPAFKVAERIETNAKNLVIFDTDYLAKNGGREKRLGEYNKVAKELGVEFLIYLLPFDDNIEGELEDLVKTCFKDEFGFFDECWHKMIACFNRVQLKHPLNLPNIDGYLYSYVDLLSKFKTIGYQNRKTEIKFLDSGLWNLEIDNNIQLKKLIDFIENNLFDKQN